eukprot:2077012-Pyramimonas_sp.AAC.1
MGNKLPFGPWSTAPGMRSQDSTWVILIMVGDDASSNRRVAAFAADELLKHHDGAIFIFQRCTIHSLHRCVIPLLEMHNVLTDLFRAANAMNVSSYWSSLGHNLEGHVRNTLLVLHNPHNDREQRKVKDQILRMTVGGNLPDEYLKPKVRKLMIDAAEALCGSWVSGQIAFHCKTDQCECGQECRDAAAKHVIDLLHRLLHKRKLLVPGVNRWWKCPPTARGCS